MSNSNLIWGRLAKDQHLRAADLGECVRKRVQNPLEVEQPRVNLGGHVLLLLGKMAIHQINTGTTILHGPKTSARGSAMHREKEISYVHDAHGCDLQTTCGLEVKSCASSPKQPRDLRMVRFDFQEYDDIAMCGLYTVHGPRCALRTGFSQNQGPRGTHESPGCVRQYTSRIRMQ